MVKTLWENLFYFLIATVINLIFFKLLYFYLFFQKPEIIQTFKPLKVEIKEVVYSQPKPKKEVKKASKKKQAPVPKVKKEGKVVVPKEKEEEVSILAELEKKIKKKVEERKKAIKEIGKLQAVVKEEKVEIKVGTRKLIYVPTPPTFKVKEFPSSVEVKIWVNPDGKVIRAILVKRSGIAQIDNGLLKFVKKLKFEKVETTDIQEGVIIFRFATD